MVGRAALRRVALVQNQSEMANYSHADCRSLLKKLGYSFELFTANSINSLESPLQAGQFDCLLLASNALHDKVIRAFFESPRTKSTLNIFQLSGGGILVLMQYKAAYDGYSFDFVVPDLPPPSAVQRPKAESALSSKVSSIVRDSAPPLLSYPNQVDLKLVQQASLDHPTLPGVYWHWWDADLASTWNAHLVCKIESEERPLLVSAQEHLGYRALMCALPIDWHAHQDLFENLLLYGCEGRHFAASVSDAKSTEPSLEYLIAKLNARKTGLREYSSKRSDVASLFNNIVEGIHNTLLLEPSITLESIFNSKQFRVVTSKIEVGDLRTIRFSPSSDDWETSVQIRGRRNPARDAYELLVPKISNELMRGFLDGSFRSTVSGLQDLEHLPYGLDTRVFPLRVVLEEADKHDRDGSYDEVIGATAGFLWLRSKGLGANEQKTLSTLAWLRERMSRVDARERLYVLGALSDAGLVNDEDIAMAKETMSELTPIDASELELLAFLGGSVKFGEEQTALAVLSEFSRRQQNDNGGPIWVDTPTTASLVRFLVEAHEKFDSFKEADSKSAVMLQELVIPSMISIEEDYQRSLNLMDETSYPWDGKASTAVRCLSAWYHFEQYLRAPVDEAAGAVVRAAKGARLTLLAEGAVGSVKNMFTEYDKLKNRLEENTAEVERLLGADQDIKSLENRLKGVSRLSIVLATLLVVLAYFIADHFIHKYVRGQELLEFGHSIVLNWQQHVSIAGFLVAIVGGQWLGLWRGLSNMLQGKSVKSE